jgi:asparagine synthase (glutamine-hydrolysing)
MCGIVGFVSNNQIFSNEDIQKACNILAHRGPDAGDIYKSEESGIALGHRRLSILDLSEAANQPFYSRDNRYIIVYNGEVYNFQELAKELQIQLRTTSDTEVLLEAFIKWGPDFVNRLNGMFAFAIYDTDAKLMYLYRDRMGIKPVYYYWDGNTFIFASELKALTSITLPKRLSINKQAISQYLHLGYIPRPNTIYNEISKMDSGTYFIISPKGLQECKYWKIEDKLNAQAITDPIVAKAQLKELIESSVKYRMISDVPFGTFLSGGIDSSLVTAVAQSVSPTPVKTFSIAFEHSKYNEAGYAKSVARHLGTNHHEFTVTYREAMDEVTKLVDIYDEPFADSSAIPTLMVSALARKHVTMTLSGDGGDELFLGYGMYQWANRLNNPVIKTFRKPIAAVLAAMGNRYERASTLFKYEHESDIKSHIFSQEQYLFTRHEISDLLTTEYRMSPSINEFYSFNRKLNAEEQQAFFDMQYYLQDDLLVKVDRATMHHSLETRVPLLDYRIVEFALNLDSDLKIKGNISKYLLKEVLYDYVPKVMFDRPKWGFSVPLADWLTNELRYLISEFLNKDLIQKCGIVNYSYVDSLINSFVNGKKYLYNRIWLLIILHQWYKKNVL